MLKQWTLNELLNQRFSLSLVCSRVFSSVLKSRLLCLSIAAYCVFITQPGKVSRLEGNTKQFLSVDIAGRWTRRCGAAPAGALLSRTGPAFHPALGIQPATQPARGLGTCENIREQTAISAQTRHSREQSRSVHGVCTECARRAGELSLTDPFLSLLLLKQNIVKILGPPD